MFFGGHRPAMMNMDQKMSLEDQIKNQDIFALQDSGYRPPPQQGQPQHHQDQQILNQFHLNSMNEMALARSLQSQYSYAPAQSPPTMFQQPTMHQPMPPRPRPEGKIKIFVKLQH